MAIKIQLLLEPTRTWTSKCFETPSLGDLQLGAHTDPPQTSTVQRNQTLNTSRLMVQNPLTSKLAKRAGSGPKHPLLSGGGVPPSSQCYSRLGTFKKPPASTTPPSPRASPSLARTGTARRCLHLQEKVVVLALPQPSLGVTEIGMAGTSPIILLTTQN